jgi:hypothetical protein
VKYDEECSRLRRSMLEKSGGKEILVEKCIITISSLGAIHKSSFRNGSKVLGGDKQTTAILTKRLVDIVLKSSRCI